MSTKRLKTSRPTLLERRVLFTAEQIFVQIVAANLGEAEVFAEHYAEQSLRAAARFWSIATPPAPTRKRANKADKR